MKRKADDPTHTASPPTGLAASFDPARRQNMQFFNQLIHGQDSDETGNVTDRAHIPDIEARDAAESNNAATSDLTASGEPRTASGEPESGDNTVIQPTEGYGDTEGGGPPTADRVVDQVPELPTGSVDGGGSVSLVEDVGVLSSTSVSRLRGSTPASAGSGRVHDVDSLDRVNLPEQARPTKRPVVRRAGKLPGMPAERVIPVFLDATYAPRQVFLRVPASVRDDLRELKRSRSTEGEKMSDGAALELACRLLPSDLDELSVMYVANARGRARASVAMAPQVRVEVYDWLHEVTSILVDNGVRASVNQLAQLALTLLRRA